MKKDESLPVVVRCIVCEIECREKMFILIENSESLLMQGFAMMRSGPQEILDHIFMCKKHYQRMIVQEEEI